MKDRGWQQQTLLERLQAPARGPRLADAPAEVSGFLLPHVLWRPASPFLGCVFPRGLGRRKRTALSLRSRLAVLRLGRVVINWLINCPEDFAQSNRCSWQICWKLGVVHGWREVRWSPEDDGERAKGYQQWVALLLLI